MTLADLPADCPTRLDIPDTVDSRSKFADTYETRVGVTDEMLVLGKVGAGLADPYMTTDFETTDGLLATASGERGSLYPSVPGYEIRGVLGKGGMGVVYKALQLRANRMVALKMILGDPSLRPDHLERFRIEAESVAGLRHPNVVQVYDVGEVAGLPYFSLEYLEGGTLAERLRDKPMTPRAAAALLATLARALHAAHLAGIVHRDLKPGNILFDADGTPKVVDFGLAKRLEAEDGQTMTGQVMGTPTYMAPEQARGENRDVGPQADIYALGAVLYESMTGRPPFKAPSVAETLHMVVFDEPVSPAKLQPKLDRDLETICLKCLEKDAKRRYASADEFADDLDRYLKGVPIRARPTPVWERGVKWARRRPARAISIGFTLAIVIAGAVTVQRYDASNRQKARREEARIADARLEAINDLDESNKHQARGDWPSAKLTLTNLLTKIRGESRLADLRSRAVLGLSQVEGRLVEDASRVAGLDRLARFRRSRDEAIFRDSRFAEISGDSQQIAARAAVASSLSAFDGVSGSVAAPGTLGPLPASFSAEQKAEVGDGQYLVLMVGSEATARPLPGEDSKTQAREALRLLDQAASLRAPTPAYHLRRATCLELVGEPGTAKIERDKAGRLAPTVAFDHLVLGQEWARRRDWDRARQQYEAALRQRPDLFWAHCLLAVADLNSTPARVTEARSELTTCLIQQPTYAWLYLLRGFAYGQVGATLASASKQSSRPESLAEESAARFEDAEGDFAEALRLGLDDSLRYQLLVNRGTMRFYQPRLDLASSDFEAAIKLDDRRYFAHLGLAQTLRKLGKLDEAVDRLGQAIAREPGLPELYRERALARLDRSDLPGDQAEAVLRDLEESARRLPRSSRLGADDHARRGRLLLRLERPDEALKAADASLAIVPDLAEAHLVRIGALLQLERYSEVIDDCNAAMARGASTADLHRLRALARVEKGDFPGAIDDYSRALAIRPDWPLARSDRGWSYLFAGAPTLAILDFEAVLRKDSTDPIGLAGRAACQSRLGRTREALADAEASLKRTDPTPRIAYNAARIYAQAATQAALEVPKRGRVALRDAKTYEVRAVTLLRQALDRTAEARRDRWLREIIMTDPSLRELRRSPAFARAIGASSTSSTTQPGGLR